MTRWGSLVRVQYLPPFSEPWGRSPEAPAHRGGVAQLVRALASHARGPGFESRLSHHDEDDRKPLRSSTLETLLDCLFRVRILAAFGSYAKRVPIPLPSRTLIHAGRRRTFFPRPRISRAARIWGPEDDVSSTFVHPGSEGRLRVSLVWLPRSVPIRAIRGQKELRRLGLWRCASQSRNLPAPDLHRHRYRYRSLSATSILAMRGFRFRYRFRFRWRY